MLKNNEIMVCNYFEFSDGNDSQFPECKIYGSNKCMLYKFQDIELDITESEQSGNASTDDKE